MRWITETRYKIEKDILTILDSIDIELSSDISVKKRSKLVAASQKLSSIQNQIALLTEGGTAPAKIAEALETLTAEIERLRRSIRKDDLHYLEPEHLAMILSP